MRSAISHSVGFVAFCYFKCFLGSQSLLFRILPSCVLKTPLEGLDLVNSTTKNDTMTKLGSKSTSDPHPSTSTSSTSSTETDQTEMGKLITAPEDKVDLDKFSLEGQRLIVIFKTAYYSFYLPVGCALSHPRILSTSVCPYYVALSILIPPVHLACTVRLG